MKLGEIVKIVNGRFINKNSAGLDYEITSINSLEEANENELSFFYDVRYKEHLKSTHSLNILIENKIEHLELCLQSDKNAIVVSDIKKSLVKIASIFYCKKKPKYQVSSFAYISDGVKLAEKVFIAPFVFLGENVEVDEGSVILPFSYIGDNCKIGRNCIIYSNVTLYSDVYVGNNVIINSGCVVGVDGFGFFKVEDKRNEKIPHFGRVVIEDDVEIFANTCIARATFGKTIISKGTKIDSLVQVAHNVKIGENTLIAAQTGIAGNCYIGKNVVLAGQVGIVDHIKVGDNAVITSKSGIAKNVPANSIYSGIPAIEHSLWKRLTVLLSKLPHILKKRTDSIEK